LNIFYLDENPKICAEMHLDKHVVKMIIEYAQLMSTAHRVLDGEHYYGLSKNGRKIARWKHPDDSMELNLMIACHVNHPSAIWTRQSDKNYDWLFSLFQNLLSEYTHRYGKIHAVAAREPYLCRIPQNIPKVEFTQPTLAMPDDCKMLNDSISSYRKYYIERKQHFAKWTKREVPSWFSEGLNKEYANL